MPDSTNQVENDRQHHAEQYRGRQRKVERGVLAAIKDVAGQAADGQIGSSEHQQEQSNGGEHDAKEHEHLANFGHESNCKRYEFCLSEYRARVKIQPHSCKSFAAFS